MKPLSNLARDHLAALRAVDTPPAEAAVGVWDGVLARAAAGDLGPELPVEPSATIAAGGATSIKAIALGVLVGAGVAIAAVAALTTDGDEPAVQVLAPGPVDLPAAIEAQPPIEAPSVTPEPISDAVPNDVHAPVGPEPTEPVAAAAGDRPASRARPTRAEAKPASDGIAQEVALLSEARSALGAGEAKQAISVLARHAKRFPAGVLARERDVSWITALCVLGKVEQARAKADMFLRLHGSSPHAAKVRASCGGTD